MNRKILYIGLFMVIVSGLIFNIEFFKFKINGLDLGIAIAQENTNGASNGDSEDSSFSVDDYLKGAEKLNLPKSDKQLSDIIVIFINKLLTFLGLIGVIIIIIGGIIWATSLGNEEKIGKAKKMIIADIIGLAVVLLAWVIVNYVIQFIIGII